MKMSSIGSQRQQDSAHCHLQYFGSGTNSVQDNAGSYNFPNDERELNRMDIEHHNQKLQIDGRLHLCPLPEDATEILDLGCGTGTLSAVCILDNVG